MDQELKRPNFYHIPRIVADAVNPHEAFVFSVIYWFVKMKEGRCFASNERIAEALPYKSSGLSVANALTALEKKGFIKRIFKDKSKRIRLEVVSLVDYTVSSTDDTRYHSQMIHVSSTGEQNNNSYKNNEYKKGIDRGAVAPRTPRKPIDINEEFFLEGEIYQQMKDALCSRIDPNLVERELRKFVNYWTEPNKTGTKVRWEQQATFDVKRRLGTWFENIKGYNSTKRGTTV